MRLNDGNVDPRGRFLAGTMIQEDGHPELRVGTLYRFDTEDFVPNAMVNGCGIPNGLALSKDGKTMYHADSTCKSVTKYDYDLDNGVPSNPKVIIRTPEGHSPDGMTISDDDELFLAVWGGHRIQRYTNEGVLLEEYVFPDVQNVDCPVFGGKNWDELFVTTAKIQEPPFVEGNKGGEIYRIKISSEGPKYHVFEL